jgi:hypothetical protein
LNPIPNTAISMGQYVVSPATHTTGSGRFCASFTVQRSTGHDAPRRVVRVGKTFASRNVARFMAVTQGWLLTCSAPPAG